MQSNLISIKELQQMLSLSTSCIYQKTNPKHKAHYDPTFPQPIRLGGRTIRWRKSDIEAWINNSDPNLNSKKETVNE
ncbi:AlpA family phage regulatory protein [Taylorella equigenitalis]|uniref:helix-turn-helix transcriptional regulator n=1 Tax=Taylorella equigenitalis TaxID=29575 RepID=UPI00237CC1C8|nr:AlpA family phage regulatory protein [Taylorella equigenitalis]WDU48703.1 AlpA family phage regulatory protein [Taylorella equigenitalis]WDU51179.1 AlpA family phage regulatory protein [Taylorella equigenitalis]